MKSLIWCMVCEWLKMDKGNGKGQGFIFHGIIPAHYTF